MNNTDCTKNIKEERKLYMREYMRKYNETRKSRRVLLTKEQRAENLKIQQLNYYNKNKPLILKKKRIVNKKNRIQKLQEQLKQMTDIID